MNERDSVEDVAAYRCPLCGLAAFYIDHWPTETEPISEKGVTLIDESRPASSDRMACGSCGVGIPLPLEMDNLRHPCLSGPDVTGRRCGYTVDNDGEYCPCCELDINRSAGQGE